MNTPAPPHPSAPPRSSFASLWKAAALFLAVAGMSGSPRLLAEGPVRDGAIEAELVAESPVIQPGRPFTVALRLKMDPKWHTYWINPGDAGYATKMTWDLPDGFSAGAIQFPFPGRFLVDLGTGPLAGLGYEGETFHLFEITPPADLAPGGEISLSGQASWLGCDDQACIPGKASLSLALAVAAEPGETGPWAEAITQARRDMPLPAPDWTLEAEESGDDLLITVTAPDASLWPDQASLFLFPEDQGVIRMTADQPFEISGARARLQVPKDASFSSLPQPFTAVLVSSAGFPGNQERRALRLNAPGEAPALAAAPASGAPESPEASPAPAAPAAVSAESSAPVPMGLLKALLGAALGGLILNLMPCVFPVISLKIMGFVSQAGESRRKLVIHGLVFTAGVLVSFWILSGILLALRFAGDSYGWGFQLQDPRFVIALILLMVVVALSLFGVFELGMSLTGVGGKLTMASGYSGSFWSGALATLLATPCTAPFMGVALGFALEQPPAISLLIFTTLALGMASPYLALSIFPGWLRRLPRPGPWMETFKQAMGFPMLAVAAWLLWVLGDQTGNDGLGLVLVGMILLSLAAWIYGRFGAPGRSLRSRRIALASAALIAVAGGAAAFQAAGSSPSAAAAESDDPADIIRRHREAGKNVFVDFTAKWCLICQANKPAMYSDAAKEAFQRHNVEFVVIDNTRIDPRIERYINRYGRTGIPFYPLYPADLGKAPLILPQNLTPGIIADYAARLEDVEGNFPPAANNAGGN